MRLNITCFAPEHAGMVGGEFNNWLPTTCCAAGCDKPAVYKVTGRVPPKQRSKSAEPDWLCFEIGLTLCEEHERTELAFDVVELPVVRKHLRDMARAVSGAQPDMAAVEITMIPFASGTA